MGRHGEGPGEFRSAWTLWVLPGDTLWAGDYRPWRYNVFTSDGEWVQAVEMNPIYGNPSRSGGVLDNGVTQSAVVEAGGSTIATGRTSQTEVRLLDDELRLRRILRWSDSDRDVSGADVRAWREDYIESRGGRNSPNWSLIDDLVVSDDVRAADVFPAFSHVEIGRDGRVWVLPYQEPRAERQRWMGFDRDGGFLCHLEHSHSGLTDYEFGADYWLGVQTDDLGVETVVVYRLTTPGDG